MILLTLFWTFLKIGLFTIGGGYAMIPLINETVLRYGWMSQEMLVDFIAIAESTPGPFAVNIATFIGAATGGFFGAVLATLGVVLPSFVIIFIIAKFFFDRIQNNRIYNDAMSGVRPVVVALIFSAFVSIAITVFFGAADILHIDFTGTDYAAIVLFVVLFVLSRIKKPFKIPTLLLVVIAAALGMLTYGVILPAIAG